MAANPVTLDNRGSVLAPIQRTALDSAGCIGSFYDGYRDIFCGKFDLTTEDKSIKPMKRSRCVLKTSDQNQNENFLEVIGMHEEQRLSVLLDSAMKNNMASVIDYHFTINEHTRYLHYTYMTQQEQLTDKLGKVQKKMKSSSLTASTTHILTDIRYGIDVVIVLQLPSEDEVALKIDDVLRRICTQLDNAQNILKLDSNDENALRQITNLIVYSNIPSLMELTTVNDVVNYINQNKNESKACPVSYIFQPIRFLFPEYCQPSINFGSIPLEAISEIEIFLIHTLNMVNQIKRCLDSFTTGLKCRNLEEPLRERQCQWLTLDDMRKHMFDRILRWVIDMRKKRAGISKNLRLFDHADFTKFDRYAKSLQEALEALKMKEQLIISLRRQEITYCNVAELRLQPDDIKSTLEQKLAVEGQETRILCTSDSLNDQNPDRFESLRNQLLVERQKNRNLRIIYADFTYSVIEPNDMEILTATWKNINRTNTSIRLPSTSKSDTNINILLLGEIGVGKSTFINALVNYLKFRKFDQAQSNTPVVPIPVSFQISTGKNRKEHRIKHGDFESSNNEDYDHPGESVTQHCKSYEFSLSDFNDKKLCIIDTPGFGHPHGPVVDDQNLQNILEYISNLSHLNAICFFLKPNTSKIHGFFDMCCTQLLDLLSPSASRNIIFCFTNTRPSCYEFGDTGRLIEISLQSFANNDIPFDQANTFCFDNEAFRYLVASFKKVQFSDDDLNDYQKSWSVSVDESNRLIRYILQNLRPCHLNDDWKSIKRAQIEITRLIRPMLETLYNMLRNIILVKLNRRNVCIKMYPNAIHRPASICLSCKPYPLQIGKFWIARDIPHEFFLKKCLVCNCTAERHIPIHYLLDYEHSNVSPNDHPDVMIQIIQQLCAAGAEFDYFLVHIAHSSKEYIFSFGLLRIIDIENSVCLYQTPKNLNSQLSSDLSELKRQYEHRIQRLKSSQQSTDLLAINQLIMQVREYHLIKAQLDATKQSQELMTELCDL